MGENNKNDKIRQGLNALPRADGADNQLQNTANTDSNLSETPAAEASVNSPETPASPGDNVHSLLVDSGKNAGSYPFSAPQFAAKGSGLGQKAGNYIGGKAAPIIDGAVSDYNAAKNRGLNNSDTMGEAGRNAGENLGNTARYIGKDLGGNVRENTDNIAGGTEKSGLDDEADGIRDLGGDIGDKAEELGGNTDDYLDKNAGDSGKNAGKEIGGNIENNSDDFSLRDKLESGIDDVKSELDDVKNEVGGVLEPAADTSDNAKETLGGIRDDAVDSANDVLTNAVESIAGIMSNVIAPAFAIGKTAGQTGLKAVVPFMIITAIIAEIVMPQNNTSQYEPTGKQPGVNCYDMWYSQYQDVFGLRKNQLNTGIEPENGTNPIVQKLRDFYAYQTGEAFKSENAFEDSKYIAAIPPPFYDESEYNLFDNIARMRTFFREYGLTDVQAAAIIGNAFVESAVDPTGVETVFTEIGVGADSTSPTGQLHRNGAVTGLSKKWAAAEANYDPRNGGMGGGDAGSDYFDTFTAIDKVGLGLLGWTDTGDCTPQVRFAA
jgi:hypothetical protein